MSNFENIKTRILEDNIWVIDLIGKEFEKIKSSEEKNKDLFIFSELLSTFRLDYQLYIILNNLNVRNYFIFSDESDAYTDRCKNDIIKLQNN